MLHIKIHQLHQRKLKIAQIAKELKISRPTVYKYLNMTFEEVKRHSEELSQPRVKKLDIYKDWIIAWLEEFPHLSSVALKSMIGYWKGIRSSQSAKALSGHTSEKYEKSIKSIKNGRYVNTKRFLNNQWESSSKSTGEKRSKRQRRTRKSSYTSSLSYSLTLA